MCTNYFLFRSLHCIIHYRGNLCAENFCFKLHLIFLIYLLASIFSYRLFLTNSTKLLKLEARNVWHLLLDFKSLTKIKKEFGWRAWINHQTRRVCVCVCVMVNSRKATDRLTTVVCVWVCVIWKLYGWCYCISGHMSLWITLLWVNLCLCYCSHWNSPFTAKCVLTLNVQWQSTVKKEMKPLVCPVIWSTLNNSNQTSYIGGVFHCRDIGHWNFPVEPVSWC